MNPLSDDLESFFSSIHMDSTEEYDDTVESVAKVLNRHYYGSDSEADHMLVVGSVGRETAVSGTSDLDLLYGLPHSEYSRFNSYKGNGQSALLQAIKEVLLIRWPRTSVKGDGQAIVITFTDRKFSIDLVPAFEQTDGSFKFPDSNHGGSWKKTDPVPEQDECHRDVRRSEGNSLRLCNALRVWKDEQGFKFGGLLIDTLVHGFLEETNNHLSFDVEAEYDMLADMFAWLSKRNAEQSYWLALGSNQQVRDGGKGAFIRRAAKANEMLTEANAEGERRDTLEALFGKKFRAVATSESRMARDELVWARKYGCTPKEEYIEDRFPVDIRNNLVIDCKVTQQGFRPMALRDMLQRRVPLLRMKTLDFYIVSTDVQMPYDVYWKVRNRGRAAFERRMVRGQLIRDAGRHARIEHTSFVGPHFVECCIIKDGKCVARDKIDVPIRES
ncbi:nucleotide-binding domain-containing protein [Olsenella uli]